VLVGNSLGIIQGRLTPSVGRGLQFFPAESWEDEFFKASELGLDSIEFVFAFEDYQNHPLWHDSGCEKIIQAIKDYGVRVKDICADFFIEQPFFRVSTEINQVNIMVLKHLIKNASRIGATNIEIPILGKASLQTGTDQNILIESIRECLPLAEKVGIKISIESDLEPGDLSILVNRFESSCVGIVYDCGNSAAYGYDCREEISILGSLINNIHIKDKTIAGLSVPLGRGSVNFDHLFKSLELIGYGNGFNLECARGDDFLEEQTVKNYLLFLKKYIDFE
jgi:L-ribulose-5-phosphate 3-epimerase